jgi:hypothetical protein
MAPPRRRFFKFIPANIFFIACPSVLNNYADGQSTGPTKHPQMKFYCCNGLYYTRSLFLDKVTAK